MPCVLYCDSLPSHNSTVRQGNTPVTVGYPVGYRLPLDQATADDRRGSHGHFLELPPEELGCVDDK